MADWLVEHIVGDAGEFHRREPALGRRQAWFFDVTNAAYVLGSAQREDSVDAAAASDRGIALVRRRSGGGGVLLMPGEFVWLDVVVPSGDPLWDDDIGRSMLWLGELWAEALAPWMADLQTHHGRFEPSPWSTAVCFAGRGPGEVCEPGGAKVVGISQRRTRRGARLQSMCHVVWRPEVYQALATDPRGDEICGAAAIVEASAHDIRAALFRSLAVVDGAARQP